MRKLYKKPGGRTKATEHLWDVYFGFQKQRVYVVLEFPYRPGDEAKIHGVYHTRDTANKHAQGLTDKYKSKKKQNYIASLEFRVN